MTFKLVLFAALIAVTQAGYINSGHAVGPTIGTPYVSNHGLLRSGSSYPSSYSYGDSSYSVPVPTAGRPYSPGVSAGHVVVRPSTSYNPAYSYGGRNSPGGVSYPSISGYGTRTLPYQSPTYASPILRNGYSDFSGFNGGFNTGFPAPLNYGHQPLAYPTPSIAHHPHGSFNGLSNGYGY